MASAENDPPEVSPVADLASSRWGRATSEAADDARAALAELAASYHYCVYAWFRRAGLEAEAVVAATLACFDRWLGEDPPRRTDPGGERMRSWLLERLTGFEGGELAVPAVPPVDLDPVWAEARYADEPPGPADAILQRRWALTVLELTVATMRAEYTARGEEALFPDLLPFAGYEAGEEDRYAEAATRHGRTVGAMHRAVFDFRHRQRELLLFFAGDTLVDPAEASSEITALLCAFDAPGPEAPAAPLPAGMSQLRPDEMLARAMQSVRMTGGGPLGWQPPTVAEAAHLFPQYEVSALLGRGGMGAVYQGRQVELDRLVAIKLLPLEVSVDRSFADRFRREARAMARLRHPNIIDVHDFGTTSEGHLFFVMEYVDGTSLDAMIRGPGLAPAAALEIIASVCEALAYAHTEGVVHRDIKPANVMLNRKGQAKVADFGLARLTDAGPEGCTVTGTIMGTPDYMAPEQKRGMNVDHRADIYSLGVMLYEMLCGEVPQGIFDPPSQRVAVDPRVDQVVMKAMQQQPGRRYQSTREMRTAVLEASGPPPACPLRPLPSGEVSPLRQGDGAPVKSKRPLLLALGAVLILLAAGGGVLATRERPAAPAPAAERPLLPGRAIDLLTLVDVQRDRLGDSVVGANQWTKTSGRLSFIAVSKNSGKLAAPASVNAVREYEMEMVVAKAAATFFVLDLPTSPGRQASVAFIPGKRVVVKEENEKQVELGAWPPEAGSPPWKVVARVTVDADGGQGTLSATINGARVGGWRGALSRLGRAPEPHPEFPGERLPALYVRGGDCAVSSWTLRTFQGEAKPLRTPAATTKGAPL